MKRLSFSLLFLLCTVAVFAQNTNEEGLTLREQIARSQAEQAKQVKAYKSPSDAGVLSFLIPGLGQFYNGKVKDGLIDLAGEAVTLGVMYYAYKQSPRFDGNKQQQNAARLFIVALGFNYLNGICSIVDAVKGAKRLNLANGYTMFDIGNGVSVGATPSLSYESPAYALHVPASLNAGMNVCISF